MIRFWRGGGGFIPHKNKGIYSVFIQPMAIFLMVVSDTAIFPLMKRISNFNYNTDFENSKI